MKNKVKIGVIPIDDRPCHTDFLKKALKNYNEIILEYPPFDCLGHFEKKGNIDKLKNFLVENALKWDYLILSLDALCYGGLVQARKYTKEENLEVYSDRLSIIKEIKKINPSIKVYAYSVIIRLTTTVSSSENLQDWNNIFDYSREKFMVEQGMGNKKQLKTIQDSINPNVLKTFLAARKRNHVVNMISVDYLSLGLIDHLSIIQEDATEYGMHLIEQKEIESKIASLNLKGETIIKNGTDEMVCVLAARILSELYGVTKVFLNLQDVPTNFISKYEDKTLLFNIINIFEEAKIEIVDQEIDSEVNCFIFPPNPGYHLDLAFEVVEQKDLSLLPRVAIDQSEKTKPFIILDLQHVNGGVIEDLQEFMIKNSFSKQKLCGYNSWNTASNSIGTATLDCLIANHGKTNSVYVNDRILDDAVFQGNVRSRMNAILNEKDIDIWNFNKDKQRIDKKLNELMRLQVNDNNVLSIDSNKEFTFPWNRTFEIRIAEVNSNE